MLKFQLIIKRCFDLIIAFVSLALLSPFIIVLYLMIRIKLGTPVLFAQKRPGLDGKPFNIIKFRTMTDDKDEQGNLLPDDKRLTSFGKRLRNTSMDELPELINVLKGEMSMVGPRPLMWKYLDRYTAFQARRHEVKPGITGWAQINGRNAISWEEKFEHDVWYVDHRCLTLDLKILIKTFSEVLFRKNVNQENHVTVTEFFGTQNNDTPTDSVN